MTMSPRSRLWRESLWARNQCVYVPYFVMISCICILANTVKVNKLIMLLLLLSLLHSFCSIGPVSSTPQAGVLLPAL